METKIFKIPSNQASMFKQSRLRMKKKKRNKVKIPDTQQIQMIWDIKYCKILTNKAFFLSIIISPKTLKPI